MSRRKIVPMLAGVWLAALAANLPAADATPAIPQSATPPIYGSRLMTPQERLEYRNKMRSLKTPEERQALRLEHHQAMQARARERGITLPDAPPAGGASHDARTAWHGPGHGWTGAGHGRRHGAGRPALMRLFRASLDQRVDPRRPAAARLDG